MAARRARVWLTLALAAAPGACVGAQPAPSWARMNVEQVHERAWVVSGYTNGNLLVLRGDSGLLVVDAQSARRVEAADSAIRTVATQPVRWVVNTHYHPDHTEGNAFFRARGATVLAHRAVPAEMKKDTLISERDWQRRPASPGAMPDALFDDSLAMDIGGVTVHVLHPPAAHTGGDAVVWIPALNVLHTGDILEVDAPPFIDLWAGGTLQGMVQACDRLLALANEETRIVPGHGPVVRRDRLLAYRDMLVTLGKRVAERVARGEGAEQVAASDAAAEYVERLGGPRGTAEFLVLLVRAQQGR